MTTCTKITFLQDEDVDLGVVVVVEGVATNMDEDVGVDEHTPTEVHIATPMEIATTPEHNVILREKIIKLRQHSPT